MLSNLRVTGCAISRKIYSPWEWRPFFEMSKENGKKWWKITLSVNWARNILESMSWLKRRGTTAKRAMNSALSGMLGFTWKKNCRESFPVHNSSGSQPQS